MICLIETCVDPGYVKFIFFDAHAPFNRRKDVYIDGNEMFTIKCKKKPRTQLARNLTDEVTIDETRLIAIIDDQDQGYRHSQLMKAVSLDVQNIGDAAPTKGHDSIKVVQLRYDEERGSFE